ncbi:hypothetical protein KC851_03805, partial [Candidatus Kaiserbacteria bacterium]|nr:hypothetical protein [Candidatus Kaiserbacteria bacterium]
MRILEARQLVSGVRTVVAVFLIAVQVFAAAGSSLPHFVNEAAAQINQQINYQGKLTDDSGVAVANGLYDMEFKLYSAPTGGSALWTETLTGGNQVQVTNGLFSVMLGAVSPLTTVDFAQTLYLGVNIESDGEMSPRKVLGAVPAAFEALELGGVASSSFLRSDVDDTADGLLTFAGGLISSASSTINNFSFTVATGTSLILNNELFNDFTGAGLSNVNGALTVSTSTLDISLEGLTDVASMSQSYGDLFYWTGTTWANLATSSLNIALDDTTGILADGRFDKSGDWTGTFDGEEGSYYLDLANATGDTDDISEGANLYYTDTRVANYINGSSTISKLGNSIDISDETNLTVGNGITLTGDQLTVTAAGGLAQAAGGLTTTGVLEDLNTLGAAASDGQFIVATGAGTFAYESGATARASLGVDAAGTDNSTDVT